MKSQIEKAVLLFIEKCNKTILLWGVIRAVAVGEAGAPEVNQCITPPLHINELGRVVCLLLVVVCVWLESCAVSVCTANANKRDMPLNGESWSCCASNLSQIHISNYKSSKQWQEKFFLFLLLMLQSCLCGL